MKAAYIEKHGNLDQIKIGELNNPQINPNEVLIETKFSALNHLDLFVIKGWPGLKLRFPHVIGADGSGIIKEIGSEVSTVRERDSVTINPGISCGKCAKCLSGRQILCNSFSIKGEHQWGTYSEFFKMPESNVLKIPEGYSLENAAAAPLTFLTAWRMLKTQANLQTGEIVFIHGAGGGVSSAAIQIAKALGARVITTTSTPEKIEKAQKVGADDVINYKEMKDFANYVYEILTNKQGVDVVIDNVGSSTFQTSLRLLKPGGRLITCGATTGPQIKIMLNQIFWKQLEIKGSTMANQEEFLSVMKLVFEEKINPIIDKIFLLEEAEKALKYLSEGKQFGKVLLKI